MGLGRVQQPRTGLVAEPDWGNWKIGGNWNVDDLDELNFCLVIICCCCCLLCRSQSGAFDGGAVPMQHVRKEFGGQRGADPAHADPQRGAAVRVRRVPVRLHHQSQLRAPSTQPPRQDQPRPAAQRHHLPPQVTAHFNTFTLPNPVQINGFSNRSPVAEPDTLMRLASTGFSNRVIIKKQTN